MLHCTQHAGDLIWRSTAYWFADQYIADKGDYGYACYINFSLSSMHVRSAAFASVGGLWWFRAAGRGGGPLDYRT